MADVDTKIKAPKATFSEPSPAEAATPQPFTGTELQAGYAGATFSDGVLRDVASVFPESIGVSAGALFRSGDQLWGIEGEVRRRIVKGSPDARYLDTQVRLFAADVRSWYPMEGKDLAVVYIPRAGIEGTMTSEMGSGDSRGGGVALFTSDEIGIGLRKGFMMSFRVTQTGELVSSDPSSPDWNLTEGVYLVWTPGLQGSRDDIDDIAKELKFLQGDDGKGGKIPERDKARERLAQYELLLANLQETERLAEGTPPRHRYDLDQLIHHYRELSDVEQMAKKKIEEEIGSRLRDHATPADEKKKLRALRDQLVKLTLDQLLEKGGEQALLVSSFLEKMDREKFGNDVEHLHLANVREFKKHYGDLDEQIATLKTKKEQLEKSAEEGRALFNAANITARSMVGMRMNEVAESTATIDGTEGMGNLFLLVVNPMQDIPMKLSVEELATSESKWVGGTAVVLIALVGGLQVWRGSATDDIGQMTNGMVMISSAGQALPRLIKGKDNYLGNATRLALGALTSLGFGLVGLKMTRDGNPDNDALGYRLMSMGASEAISGAVIAGGITFSF
ncbi:MAG: hypothetical protein HYT76_07490 [Deltaproteobacteria bacterium]|nr:hypothetical protein [Deltaproteobacteria bacterium]